MSDPIETLQARYGHAIFQIAHYQKVAELLKCQIEEQAIELARAACREYPSPTPAAAPITDDAPIQVSTTSRSVSTETGELDLLYHAEDYRPGGRFFGVLASVAKSLKVSYSLVRKVNRGVAVSHSISAALSAERSKVVGATSNGVTLAQLSPDELAQFVRGGRYWGVYTRVAKRLGVNRGVPKGASKGMASYTILNAVREEMRTVDQALRVVPRAVFTAAQVRQLSDDERLLFRTGRKYCGLMRLLTARFGFSKGYASSVVCGRIKNDSVMAALRSEMSRVDAEAAAIQGERA